MLIVGTFAVHAHYPAGLALRVLYLMYADSAEFPTVTRSQSRLILSHPDAT
jgi:hypothetical protein